MTEKQKEMTTIEIPESRLIQFIEDESDFFGTLFDDVESFTFDVDIPEICRNGHLRTEANTYNNPDGRRECKECKQKAYREGERAKEQA